MEASNIIAIVLGGTGFIISIIGLVVTPRLNLKSKKLEKRLEYRLQLFQKVLELWEFTNKNQYIDDETAKGIILEVNKRIQLYGYNTEIKLFREFITAYNRCGKEQTEISRQELTSSLSRFFENSFNTYRKEIRLKKLME
jgi:hypothetical protein